MQKFDGKDLCCDTTYGTTGYEFELNSLLPLNEFEEGVPVTFCLSNRENFGFMELFFSQYAITLVQYSLGPLSVTLPHNFMKPLL